MPIKVHFVLKRDEFFKALGRARSALPEKIKWLGYAQFGLLFTLMLTGVAYRPGGELQPVSLIVFVLVWLVWVTQRVAFRAGASLRFASMADREIWYEFDEVGFRCGLPHTESRISWPIISSFIETDALFVVMASDFFYTIPKRVLATDDVGALRQLLLEKVSH